MEIRRTIRQRSQQQQRLTCEQCVITAQLIAAAAARYESLVVDVVVVAVAVAVAVAIIS